MAFYGIIALVCVVGLLIAFFTFKGKVKLIFCIGWGVVVLFSLMFLCFGPKTQVKPVIFDKGRVIDTFNKVVVYVVSIEYFLCQLSTFLIVKTEKSTSPNAKPIIGSIILATIMVALGVGWAIYTIRSII